MQCDYIIQRITQYYIARKFQIRSKMTLQNTSLAQLKLRTNEFIEDYEKQVTQREYQKQKLKQNIMLQIMSSRHKSQTSQSNANQLQRLDSISQEVKFKKSVVGPVSQDRGLSYVRNNGSGLVRSNSVPNAVHDQINNNLKFNNQDQVESAQITFKMSKNRQGFQSHQPKSQESYENQNIEHEDDNLDQNETLRQPKQKSNKTIDSIQQPKKKSMIKQPQFQQSSLKYRQKQSQIKAELQNSQTEHNEHVQQQIEQYKPIFLTLDENQSVQISQDKRNKNYAFDIAMEKSQPIQDIQQLRKRKIQQMEKKRQLRMEEFRKQEQIKKNNMDEKDNKRSNSSMRVSNRVGSSHQGSKGSDEIEVDIPKSKSKKKIVDRQDKVNLSSQNITQESHYNMRPPQQPQRSSYLMNQQKDDYQTPKTINSEYRLDKSKGKGTIFRQSPKRLDKSASKYSQDPKIQPKSRLNTFNKQSNKKLMITAINACLPGQLNRKDRQKLVQVIQREPSEQFFVFLFKEYTRKIIKAIYILDPTQSFISKVYGEKAPQQIYSENVKSFYRFDSGSRQFKKLDGNKSFSFVVHAIDLIA